MAKFVEWANSLLGRFEEQVSFACQVHFEKIFQKFFAKFSKMSHEKKIDKTSTGDFLLPFFSASVPNGNDKYSGENQHGADGNRTEFDSNIEI